MKKLITKILLIDIETAPKLANVWSMFKANVSVDMLRKETYILCWNAKWLGSKEVLGSAIWDFKNYKKDPEDDAACIRKLWKLLNKADIVIGHNGDRFDVPTLNARFVVAGIQPPDPYKTVDTLKVARKNFRFDSNKLDALSLLLGLGRKKDTGGFILWADVMQNKPIAQRKMVSYCAQDVKLLEKVYLKLRAWEPQIHPLSLLEGGDTPICNACGSTHVHKRGWYHAQTRMYRRFKCVECGHNMRSTSCDKESSREGILRSV